MKSIFYFVTKLENIIQCILSVELCAPQIFLFDRQAWKHDSKKIVVTAVIKCLSKQYFLFRGPAWKYFVVHIISHKCTANIFVLTVRLENIIPREIIGYNNIYLLCKYYSLECKNVLFQGSTWKKFACYVIRQTSLTVRLKNMILLGLSLTAIIHLKWKVSFIWYQAAMISKLWYGACLLIYIMYLYILLFILYTFTFLISILIVFRPSVHWHLALLVRQARKMSPPLKAKELWIEHGRTRPQHSACELPHMHLFLPETDLRKL